MTPACAVADRPEKFERKLVTLTAEVVSIWPHGVVAIQRGCKRNLLLDPRFLKDATLWNTALQRVTPLMPRRRTQLALTGTVQRVADSESATGSTYIFRLLRVAH